MATIQGLYVYPVKSARAISLARTTIGPAGLAWDRHWMVVDAAGTFLTQRVAPRLACIVPALEAKELVLRAPGLPPLAVPLAGAGAEVPVRVWKHVGTALDAGPAAAEWLTGVLGQPVRLVRVSPAHARVADPAYTGPTRAPVAFPDGFPVLVCNRASLEALNAQLPQPVPMDRFRPNVVLEGLPPWAEDRIATLQIGAVTLRLVKPCARCVIPSLDQITGERSTDPTPVLQRLRFDRELRGVTFGENAVLAAGDGATLERGSGCAVTYESP
jgi:uncharacterized protein YcbX